MTSPSRLESKSQTEAGGTGDVLNCISSDQIGHSVAEKEKVTGFDGGANQTVKTHER